MPPYNKEEDALHILLKCLDARKLREYLLSRKWLRVNEVAAYRKIINCTNTLEIRNIGSHLYNIRCKWENIIKEIVTFGVESQK
jgi:hypothetical protein